LGFLLFCCGVAGAGVDIPRSFLDRIRFPVNPECDSFSDLMSGFNSGDDVLRSIGFELGVQCVVFYHNAIVCLQCW
jgi:hypothetical protein